MNPDSSSFAQAFEDLPEEARLQAAEIAGTQPGIGLRRRLEEELATFGLDGYGALEECRLLHFLSRYPVTAYTYPVSLRVSRGQRPDAAKLAALADGHVGATINLCAEMADGDAPAILAAGLSGRLRTTHVPITDMESPTPDQLTTILDLLSGPGDEQTYVHCEAGKGRTGVVIACYRMAVTGWGVVDALTEAVNFGCVAPGQVASIRAFGDLLEAGPAAGEAGPLAGRYPLLPVGSVSATPAQLAATLRLAADTVPPGIVDAK